MKVNIYQRGGSKENHHYLEDASQYFAKMLMSTRMRNTLNIRLEMRASKLDNDVLGTCATEAKGSAANKNFTIVIQRDMPLGEQLETLSHELVHVWQKSTNKLQYRQWKSDKKMHVRWNGEELGLSEDIPYRDRPWEKEAYGLERPMLNAYVCHLNEKPDREEVYIEAFSEKIKHFLKERESSPSLEM